MLFASMTAPTTTSAALAQASIPSGCGLDQRQCANGAVSTGEAIDLHAGTVDEQLRTVGEADYALPSAQGPPQRWAYVPACPANGPPGTLGDTLCIGATESCGQAGQVRFREYLSIGNGPWVATRTVCLGAAEFQQANTPLPPLVLALDVWRRMLFPDPKLTIKPGAGGLANLESYFWISGPFTQSVTATAGPNQVTVDAVAASYEWRFGDGSAPLVTGVPGRPWPARSEIAHAYRQLGRFEVQVTVRWQGRFRVNGGPSQVVPGPPVARSSTVTYPVRELQTVLTR
jgi:PKD domain